MSRGLAIRVLGELEIELDGALLALPASKKTRALLVYLAMIGRPQPRQRLCDLFFDGPDDPRAALRWSLTKLRPLLDDGSIARLVADRERVSFEPTAVTIDVAELRAEIGSIENIPSVPGDVLRRAASRFRGELLEGLDLPGCYRYHEWCIAEREAVRRLRTSILAALTERLRDQPEEALVHARARVTIDPETEAGHIAVMQLLSRLGRTREALRQYETCRRIIEGQLGGTPSRELEVARMELGRPSPGRTAKPAPAAQESSTSLASTPASSEGKALSPLVGRREERAHIAAMVRGASAGRGGQLLLFVGESGIGKTRLLEEVGREVRALGGDVLWGRAFEAEMVRPYGPWIDALRSAAFQPMQDALRADLAPLLPELGDAPAGDRHRNRLFDAVAKLLRDRATSSPVALVLDDIHWFDEASAALLHFVARAAAGTRIALACGARPGELGDNSAVQSLVHGLGRDGRLEQHVLPPLSGEETAELVRAAGGDRLDPGRVFHESGGNPLFSLEIARSLARGDAGTSPTLDGLIAERLSRLEDRAHDLIPWAAALGHGFSLDLLGQLTSAPPGQLLGAIEELERRGVLEVSSPAGGRVGYDFVHDLVRQVAYRQISDPRRAWIHLHIARTLSGMRDPDGALAGDIAHHAALGGDSELAARSYVVAAQRSLRIYALAEASELAARGIQHLDRLPRDLAISLHLDLLSIHAHSNRWLGRVQELDSEVSRVVLEAQTRDLNAEVARGFYILSFLHHESGDVTRAQASTLRAAAAGRAADPATARHQLANSGRCLALCERDMVQAKALLHEAEALAPGEAGSAQRDLLWGLGLMCGYEGDVASAVPLLERSAALAAQAQDHWAECLILTRLASLALEEGRPAEALARCEVLGPLAAKLTEGSEAPFAATLRALARAALAAPDAEREVEAELATLRAIDSKAHLAYALNFVAQLELRALNRESARRRAEEALRAAEAVDQRSERAISRALLARLAAERGDRDTAARLLDEVRHDLASPLRVSARAAAAVTHAAEQLGLSLTDA